MQLLAEMCPIMWIGNELALVTCTAGQQFHLSLYDVRAPSETYLARHVHLEPLAPWYEDTDVTHGDPTINKLPSTVNQVSYSPDGVFIAVATSNNVTHVYDSRYLNRILYEFPHQPGVEGTVDDTKFGVYKIDWMVNPLTDRLSLVSGGADGTS